MKKKKKNDNSGFIKIINDDSEYIENMAKLITNNTEKVWLPTLDIKYKNNNINTWFNIQESKNINNKNKNIKVENDKLSKIEYNSIKVNLIFNKKQKEEVDKWFESFRKMYNETLYYIKNNNENKGFSYNWIKIRKIIKNKRDKIAELCTIKVHELDFAIKLACQNYKSCLTNFKNGNIKHFRVRYWGYGKQIKLVKLEKMSFKNGTIRKQILGKIKASYDNKNYDLSCVKTDSELQFNKRDNKYYLYVPQKINSKKKYDNRNEYISCDPGIRTFIMGLSENKAIKICDNDKTIKDYLKKKDRILENKNIPKRIKNKNERQINKKLENLKNELHWKTINYLTKNYKFILIGNMSTKRIISKKNNLNEMSKRIVCAYNLYQFRERLKYKCDITSTKYKLVDEKYTSKMCSKCGVIDKNLGSNKIYNCVKCKTIMDRDLNGARCILLKSMQ